MRIGHTLFGGAITGLVVASGVALCMSSAYANTEKNCFVYSNGVARSESFVDSQIIKVASSTITSSATANGVASTSYIGKLKPAITKATCNGKSLAIYKGYGTTTASADMRGYPTRHTKGSLIKASSVATASGTSYVWQVVHGKGIANSYGYGTTYYVGNGLSTCTANIYGKAVHIIGGASNTTSTAVADGTVIHNVSAYGLASANANSTVDTAVTKAGVKYVTTNGNGYSLANASLTHINIYQSQTGNCKATGTATCLLTVGLKSSAVGTCTGIADGDLVVTAVGTLTGETSSIATGYCTYYAKAKSVGIATANGSDAAIVLSSKSYGVIANATCNASNTGSIRLHKAISSIVCKAVSRNSKYTTTILAGNTSIGPNAVAVNNGINLLSLGKKAECTANIYGNPSKIQTSKGACICTAVASGYLQINDINRAPIFRTIEVMYAGNVINVPEEIRLIKV